MPSFLVHRVLVALISLCYYCYSILCFYFCEEIVTEWWLCVQPFCVIHHLCNCEHWNSIWYIFTGIFKFCLCTRCHMPSISCLLGITIRLIVILHSLYVAVVHYKNIASVSKMCYQSSLNKWQCILLPIHTWCISCIVFIDFEGFWVISRGMISYQILWISVNWFRSWSGWTHVHINVCTCT